MTNTAVIEKWVEALESGEYEQGVGTLRRTTFDGNKFCCLGVLCDIAVKEGVIPEPTVYDSTATYGVAREVDVYRNAVSVYRETSNSALPAAVQEWAGVDSPSPMMASGSGLITLNDNAGLNFDEIAAELRETFLVPVSV